MAGQAARLARPHLRDTPGRPGRLRRTTLVLHSAHARRDCRRRLHVHLPSRGGPALAARARRQRRGHRLFGVPPPLRGGRPRHPAAAPWLPRRFRAADAAAAVHGQQQVLRLPHPAAQGSHALRVLRGLRGRLGPPLPLDGQVHRRGEPQGVPRLPLHEPHLPGLRRRRGDARGLAPPLRVATYTSLHSAGSADVGGPLAAEELTFGELLDRAVPAASGTADQTFCQMVL
mmetsp:Transcript_18825/g.39151  ORF Transcript_18825/g.39151 Transcript_18825/m.39151 type:complete len:230 (-) Transcript_18825:19-708(-)